MSLNISDFNLFYVKIAVSLLKKVPPSFTATPSKSWGPVKSPPPFWKFGWRLNSPWRKEGGAHYDMDIVFRKIALFSQFTFLGLDNTIVNKDGIANQPIGESLLLQNNIEKSQVKETKYNRIE